MTNTKKSSNQFNYTCLTPENAAYLEEIYAQFKSNPGALDQPIVDAISRFESSPDSAKVGSIGTKPQESKVEYDDIRKQAAVHRLIGQYHMFGHLQSKLDPLELTHYESWADLSLESVGLSEEDLDTEFKVDALADTDAMPLRDIVKFFDNTYCSSIGYEYMYITDPSRVKWLQQRIENTTIQPTCEFDQEKKINILQQLTMAEGLETYLHTKYVGQKRFSLEGGESLIPLLRELILLSGDSGTKEVVIGMAHRGRLNALVNILGKIPSDLFGEFEGQISSASARLNEQGDVKYHMGFSSDINTPGGIVHVALAFNPSHLEIINGVVQGSVRARQHRRLDKARNEVIPILVHGDAAFAGQGVVMEILNMSHIRGFEIGGTIHVIINNQIGFTTSNRLDARSTLHCTEVAKMVQAPIFHVNGDDPEAVVFVTQLAHAYRQKFQTDVVIDLVCYRRYGHNEADEPTMTQPVMYQAIKQKDPVRRMYAQKLVDEGVITDDKALRMVMEYRDMLDRGQVVAGQIIDPGKAEKMVDWSAYMGVDWTQSTDTSTTWRKIKELNKKLMVLPDGFELHNRVKKILEDRQKMATGDIPIDWGFAENMAYACLVDEGFQVRLSGQDSGRGTFSHRHALLHDQKSRAVYVPLKSIRGPQDCQIYNSVLSEEAVLAFEYGYAATDPNSLVIWEAQFGDFANGAQIVIDQFISSGEAKWARLCGLTMLLPHGYEGQGPEHSSARIERFLQLCAHKNIQVCAPTTPSQMFHLLRRQAIRPYRHPLIIMSPKSMLRLKSSFSTLEDLTDSKFHTIIDEFDENLIRRDVQRVILCSGKVYYDLADMREHMKAANIAILRIEQLYPFPKEELRALLSTYFRAKEVVWCQEEPRNQGAWYQIRHLISECLTPKQVLKNTCREEAASPAVGNFRVHLAQQERLVIDALSVDRKVVSISDEREVRADAS